MNKHLKEERAMSEKDIIKAVECCIKLHRDCNNCPLQKALPCTAILREKILKYIKK